MAPRLDNLIQRVLPHRHPFLFVDRVTELVPGRRIVGIKNFTVNDDASQGYHAGAGLVPAGVVFEIVTQLGAILVLERPEMQGKVAVIVQVPIARLLEPIFLNPGR